MPWMQELIAANYYVAYDFNHLVPQEFLRLLHIQDLALHDHVQLQEWLEVVVML